MRKRNEHCRTTFVDNFKAFLCRLMVLFYSGGPAVVILILCIVFGMIFCHKRMKEAASRQVGFQPKFA